MTETTSALNVIRHRGKTMTETPHPCPTDEELYAAARELTTTSLLPKLKALIPADTTPLESTLGAHTKHIAAPTPWNDPAAMLYYEIHADARRYESQLSIRLFQRAKYRPGDDANLTEAINRLPVLIAHGRAKGLDPVLDLADPTNALLSWAPRIRILLDEALPGEIPPAKAPGGLRCPHCHRPLYLNPGWQYATADTTQVHCRHCRDDAGRRLTWPAGPWLARLQSSDPKGRDAADPLDPEHTMTARDAVHYFGLSADQVYVWKHRGRIAPVGTDRDGRDLYRNADLAALVSAARSTVRDTSAPSA